MSGERLTHIAVLDPSGCKLQRLGQGQPLDSERGLHYVRLTAKQADQAAQWSSDGCPNDRIPECLR